MRRWIGGAEGGRRPTLKSHQKLPNSLSRYATCVTALCNTCNGFRCQPMDVLAQIHPALSLRNDRSVDYLMKSESIACRQTDDRRVNGHYDAMVFGR